MLQSSTHLRLDQALYLQYLLGVHDCFLAVVLARSVQDTIFQKYHSWLVVYRIGWTWGCQSCYQINETFLLSFASLRSVLHSDLLSFDIKQLDLRWCSVYCNWSWFRNVPRQFQYAVLSFCGPEYLPWYEDAYHVTLRDNGAAYPSFDLLLDHDARSLSRTVHFQPAPVLIGRFHYWL